MRLFTLGYQARALIYAKAVLLVGYYKGKVFVLNIIGKQRVGADYKVKLTGCKLSLDLALLLCGH